MTVPSLLKRWKRLEAGLELSAEAFLNRSKRFKTSTKDWAQADEDAQRTRSRKPESMDIYDTIKGQGLSNIILRWYPHLCNYSAPSRADIQEGLRSEETAGLSIQGQASWISCGLKIQEMQ